MNHNRRSHAASYFGLAIAITTLALPGCDSNRTRLVGTWISDSVSIPGTDQATPLDNPSSADPSANDAPNSIQLRFYRSGRLDTVTQLPNIQTQKTGKWRFVSYNEVTQTAVIEFELMQQRTQHEVEYLDPSTIRLVPPNMAGLSIKLTFKRK